MIKVQDCSVSGTKDNLRIPRVAHALKAQIGEHWSSMAEAPGSISLLLDFLLSCTEACDVNIVTIANLL